MPQTSVRVVTYLDNFSGAMLRLSYWLAAWRASVGNDRIKLSFSIVTNNAPGDSGREERGGPSEKHEIRWSSVAGHDPTPYGRFWPLAFLDETYAEDLVVFAAPFVFPTGDVTALLSDTARGGKLVVHERELAQPFDAPTIDWPSPERSRIYSLWLALIPNSQCSALKTRLAATLNELGNIDACGYGDSLAFSLILLRQQMPFVILPADRLLILDASPAEPNRSTTVENSEATQFHLWGDEHMPCTGDIFLNRRTLRVFLDRTNLTAAELVAQANLRRIRQRIEGDLLTNHRGVAASFFRRRGNPYYIYAPDFAQHWAGVRCLHYLCHALNEMGEEAYVYPAKGNDTALRTPRLDDDIRRRHFLLGLTPIAVYPEVVSGTPLQAPITARWLLNRPGHLGGATVHDASELLYYFSEWILPSGMVGQLLTTPTVDTSIFNNDANPDDLRRQGSCYYAHKFLAFGGEIDAAIARDSVSLCQDVPRSPMEIAGILRKSVVLYCYEQSSLITEALLCGCPVIVIATDYWEQSKWPDGYLPTGVALNTEPDALARVRREVGRYRAEFDALSKESWATIEDFVCDTQRAASAFASAHHWPAEERASGGQPDAKALWAIPAAQRDKYLPRFEKTRLPPAKRAAVAEPEAKVAAATDSGPQHSPTLRTLTQQELALFGRRIGEWTPQLFHTVVVDDNASEAALTRTLQSLLGQHYGQVIATIVATRPAPYDLGPGRLVWWQTTDSPWLLVNEAISQSPAQWCGVIRAGDTVAPQAFLVVGEYINAHADCRALYCDEDVIDDVGNHSSPKLKPDFDIVRLRADGYVGGLLLGQKSLWQQVGGWQPLPRGVDELDAALRLAEACGPGGLGHVPGILYHRSHSDPALQVPAAPLQELRRQVVEGSLLRLGIAAVAEIGATPDLLRLRHRLEAPPLVSLIIPTKDSTAALEACLNSFVESTDYPNFEILVIDNGSTEQAARAYLDGVAALGDERIRVLAYDQSFNLAALINLGAAQASGDLLLLLHDDIKAAHPDWLFNMAALCMQPGIGAVGARLLKPDGTLDRGWITPIKIGITAAPFHGWPLDAPDSQRHLNSERAVAAISSACMLVRKDIFQQVGGFDPDSFSATTADIDFCFKLRKANYRIVWTPYATLVHDSDGTIQASKDDNNALLAKWGKTLVNDPCVNPYLSIGGEVHQMEGEAAFFPDVVTWHPLPNIYAMSSDFDGAGHYRVIQPIQGATEAVLARGRLGRGYPIPAMMEKLDIDIVFSQRQVEDSQLRNLARYRKLLRARIVMDIDDLITNVPDKNIHKKTLLKDMKSRVRQLAEIAHRFTVSTEPLAEEYRQYHNDIRVVPNALLRAQWAPLTSQRATSRKLRVGWAGGVSHRGDLEVIRDVVRELADEVEWVFMGMCLQELAPHIKEFHDGAVFSAYPAKLASLNLDLAIAPLEINRFNECKSHLRLLEYGILGVPVVATDIHPYRSGFPVTLVKNKHKDWVRAIREHINDRDETYRRGDQLRQHVLDRWMLDQHLTEWLNAWT
jgi:GT2 family glycosyltransferase